MEHPGLSVTTIKAELNLEEIQEKIQELRRRVTFAYRINNHPMVNQLEMMLAVYTRAQHEILDSMFASDEDDDHNGTIDIS